MYWFETPQPLIYLLFWIPLHDIASPGIIVKMRKGVITRLEQLLTVTVYVYYLIICCFKLINCLPIAENEGEQNAGCMVFQWNNNEKGKEKNEHRDDQHHDDITCQ